MLSLSMEIKNSREIRSEKKNVRSCPYNAYVTFLGEGGVGEEPKMWSNVTWMVVYVRLVCDVISPRPSKLDDDGVRTERECPPPRSSKQTNVCRYVFVSISTVSTAGIRFVFIVETRTINKLSTHSLFKRPWEVKCHIYR